MIKLPNKNSLIAMLALFSAVFILTSCSESIPTDPVARKIYDRKQHFKTMGRAFKFIDDEIAKKYPDFEQIKQKAEEVYQVGQNLPDWFDPDTGPNSGFETDAKADVWQQQEKFKSVYREFLVESERLIASSGLADKNAVQAQYHTTGVTCSNCHKPFRVDKD